MFTIGGDQLNVDRPSYFSILTADVRYSKNLTAEEKILFSEITALSNKSGWCFATNIYFAKLYNTTERTISRRINSLKEFGFIEVINDRSTGFKRHIKPVLNPSDRVINGDEIPRQDCPPPVDKSVYPPRQVCLPPLDKSVHHNNTSINNKYNNKSLIGESEVRKVIRHLNSKSPNFDIEDDDEIAVGLIFQRTESGIAVEDLMLIVDFKHTMWNGTDTYQYMTVNTLFGERHFKKYLNEAKSWEKNGRPEKLNVKKQSNTNKGKSAFSNQRSKANLGKLVKANRMADRREVNESSTTRSS